MRLDVVLDRGHPVVKSREQPAQPAELIEHGLILPVVEPGEPLVDSGKLVEDGGLGIGDAGDDGGDHGEVVLQEPLAVADEAELLGEVSEGDNLNLWRRLWLGLGALFFGHCVTH
jgi:hypothetical protein